MADRRRFFRGMAGVETITFCHSWMNLATPELNGSAGNRVNFLVATFLAAP